ncbi:MAG: M23 family metallopeptidase [Oscillatoriophycideae cyanobacterium NC_groundwater_1537_Pr4_S-0.65um_50_18]|nr:M23 family metallopeptidase [Oscillatoriophycideae cyanobacterium NC_groundwater_1537_Pr4_S-0.65um_50_18]
MGNQLTTLSAALRLWLQKLWKPRLWVSGFLALAALVTVLNSAAVSGTASLQATPTNPQLGDTVTLLIQTDGSSETSPTVVMNQKTYPSFAIAPNRYRALLPTTPLDPPGRLNIQVNGVGDPQALVLQLRDRDFPTQSIWLSGGGSDGTDYEFDKVDAFKALVTPEKLWNGKFQRPSEGEITTVYGVRRYYNGEFAQDYYHRGVDYGAGIGSPIVAPAAGKVALIGREADGFQLHGNTIGVDHGQGVVSIFLHLSRIDVKEGDIVSPGQQLGAVGATGGVTGPHLHWGLYVNGQSIDPVPWRYDGFE